MTKKRTIFLTGATGLVGSYLLKILLENGHKVYALARGNAGKSARQRVIDTLRFWDKKVSTDNLNIVEGNISNSGLGLNSGIKNQLKKEVDEIFHCAAETGFNFPLKYVRAINVNGTKNVLNLALQLHKNGVLQKVNYISTVYVCGTYKGKFSESDFDLGQGFNTSYEKSKFEAEMLVRNTRKKRIRIDIFRPSIVIGETRTGRISTFSQGFYQLFHILRQNIFDFFPAKNYFVNLVPVDELCKSIVVIASKTKTENKTYHLFKPKSYSLEKILNRAAAILRFKNPKLISTRDIPKYNFSPIQKKILQKNILLFNSAVHLDSQWTNSILERHNFKFSDINYRMLTRQMSYFVSGKSALNEN
jgi:thioester reductase-like protein